VREHVWARHRGADRCATARDRRALCVRKCYARKSSPCGQFTQPWSGSPSCSQLSFEAVDRALPPGYYNATETTWGGNPIRGEDGRMHLVVAQMENHCNVRTMWQTNSYIARTVSTTGSPLGPYQFAERLIPTFSHNPMVRRAKDGTFVIFFIGGWPIPAEHVAHCNVTAAAAPAAAPVGASAAAAAAAAAAPMLKGAGKETNLSSYPNCSAWRWPKSCGPAMPGPNGDGCGPAFATAGYPDCATTPEYACNDGCGIAVAYSKSIQGPWAISRVRIVDQFQSDDLYCAHTNPSPLFLPNGSVILAFGAGSCSCAQQYNASDGGASCGQPPTGDPTTEAYWSTQMGSHVGLAISHRGFLGPWHLISRHSILRNPLTGGAHFCEDPFIWKSSRGWHLLVHNLQPLRLNSSGKPEWPNSEAHQSAYAYSEDGLQWHLSSTSPYNCTVTYSDGSRREARNCGNRPQLLFGDDGQPEILIDGVHGDCDAHGSGCSGAAQPGKHLTPEAWTLFRPLSQTAKTGADI